jgi:hypothetical protein
VKIPFGRYRGRPLNAVPRDYLRWLLRQPNVRPNLRIALKRELRILAAPAPAFDFKRAAGGDVGEGEAA